MWFGKSEATGNGKERSSGGILVGEGACQRQVLVE